MADQQIDTALAPAQPSTMAPRNEVLMGSSPTTLDQAIALATVMAKSTLVPKDFQNQPANIVIAVQLGAELGLAPMQSLQSIAVINGRPSVWGDGLLGLVMRSGLLEDINEPEVGDDMVATCTVLRKGWSHPVTRAFTKKDAEKAGLWGKAGPWQTYPRRMLQMRARTFALRDVFADVLRGLTSIEEASDIQVPFDEVTGEILPRTAVQARVIEMPRAKGEAKPAAVETSSASPAAPPTPAAAPRPAAPAATTPAPAQTHGGSAPSAHVSSQAPQAAPSAPAAALQAGTHVIKSVVERKSASGRVYYLVTTQAGLVAHTWSSTVAGEAGQAKTDGCPVRLVGKDTTFASAPLQITKVERAEREPGDEAF